MGQIQVAPTSSGGSYMPPYLMAQMQQAKNSQQQGGGDFIMRMMEMQAMKGDRSRQMRDMMMMQATAQAVKEAFAAPQRKADRAHEMSMQAELLGATTRSSDAQIRSAERMREMSSEDNAAMLSNSLAQVTKQMEGNIEAQGVAIKPAMEALALTMKQFVETKQDLEQGRVERAEDRKLAKANREAESLMNIYENKGEAAAQEELVSKQDLTTQASRQSEIYEALYGKYESGVGKFGPEAGDRWWLTDEGEEGLKDMESVVLRAGQGLYSSRGEEREAAMGLAKRIKVSLDGLPDKDWMEDKPAFKNMVDAMYSPAVTKGISDYRTNLEMYPRRAELKRLIEKARGEKARIIKSPNLVEEQKSAMLDKANAQIARYEKMMPQITEQPTLNRPW